MVRALGQIRSIRQGMGPGLVSPGNRPIPLARLAMAGPAVVGIERCTMAGVASGWWAMQRPHIGHQIPALLLGQRLPPSRHHGRTMKRRTPETNGAKELL